MSNQYEYSEEVEVPVQINLKHEEQELIGLSDILQDSSYVAEVIKALDSNWARSRGWQAVEHGKTYRMDLAAKAKLPIEVALEMQILDKHNIRLVRAASTCAYSDAQSSAQQTLEQVVRQANNLARKELHEVLSEGISLNLMKQAAELSVPGSIVVTDTGRLENGYRDVRIRMQLNA